MSQAQEGTGTADGGRVLKAGAPSKWCGIPDLFSRLRASLRPLTFPTLVLFHQQCCPVSQVSPDPPDLICAMFIISVLYFCTESYWSTLERRNSCSVAKRTFLDPRSGWPPSPCALDHPPRHEDSLNLDKCGEFLLSHSWPSAGSGASLPGGQGRGAQSGCTHSRAAWPVHPLATPMVTPA